jgi:hypothetical protein
LGLGLRAATALPPSRRPLRPTPRRASSSSTLRVSGCPPRRFDSPQLLVPTHSSWKLFFWWTWQSDLVGAPLGCEPGIQHNPRWLLHIIRSQRRSQRRMKDSHFTIQCNKNWIVSSDCKFSKTLKMKNPLKLSRMYWKPTTLNVQTFKENGYGRAVYAKMQVLWRTWTMAAP